MSTPNPVPPISAPVDLPPTSFWSQHGTKILGYVIAISSALAAGSIALPPPLSTYHEQITSWSIFISAILGILVIGRGYGNTAANAKAITAGVAAQVASVPPGVIQHAPTAPLPAPHVSFSPPK